MRRLLPAVGRAAALCGLVALLCCGCGQRAKSADADLHKQWNTYSPPPGDMIQRANQQRAGSAGQPAAAPTAPPPAAPASGQ